MRAAAFALVLVAGCAHSRAPDAILVVRAPVPAQLYVDDIFVGGAGNPTSGRTVGLHAGPHRVEVRAEGKLPTYRDVDLKKGDRITLDVPLNPDLDSDDQGAATTATPATGKPAR